MILRQVALVVALLTASLIGFNMLMNVTEPDIIAVNRLDRPAVGALQPGDIVALSPDRLRMERICSYDLESGQVEEEPLAFVYYNGLRESLPAFAAAADWVGALWRGGDEKARRLSLDDDGIRFLGSRKSLAEVRTRVEMSERCECEMALRLNARQPVCTVNTTMVEYARPSSAPDATSRRMTARTVAVTLAQRSNWVAETKFAACGFEMSDAARATMQQPCATTYSPPIDTRVRLWLNLIEKRELVASAGATSGG